MKRTSRKPRRTSRGASRPTANRRGLRVVRNVETTIGDLSGPHDWTEREAEAERLMRDDIMVMLDEAERRVDSVKNERRFTTIDLQQAAISLLRAAMLAEVAYVQNCASNDTHECWRSGEIINDAQSAMMALIAEARDLGIRQAQQAERERRAQQEAQAASRKKKWLPW